MAFSLPTFNLSVNVWHGLAAGSTPPFGPPSISGLLVNFSLGRRVLSGTDSRSVGIGPGTGVGIDVLFRIMMAPAGTDLRSVWQDPAQSCGDYVEAPAGSGAFYIVQDVADMAKGFPNEHRLAWVTPAGWILLPSPLP
jgi:hypothetical protein